MRFDFLRRSRESDRLQRGKVVQHGDYQELIKQGGVFAELTRGSWSDVARLKPLRCPQASTPRVIRVLLEAFVHQCRAVCTGLT